MMPSTGGAGAIKLFAECHRRSIKARQMCLIPPGLQVQGWQMVVCREGPL
jgi:hypothetical protein